MVVLYFTGQSEWEIENQIGFDPRWLLEQSSIYKISAQNCVLAGGVHTILGPHCKNSSCGVKFQLIRTKLCRARFDTFLNWQTCSFQKVLVEIIFLFISKILPEFISSSSILSSFNARLYKLTEAILSLIVASVFGEKCDVGLAVSWISW